MTLQAQADQDLVFQVTRGQPSAKADQDLVVVVAQRLVPAIITTQCDQDLVFQIAQRIVPLVELIGGGYQNFLGTPLADGYLVMNIQPNLEVYTAGEEILEGGISFRINLDANGNCLPGQKVFSNSVLNPSGSVYQVRAFAADGTTASDQQLFTVPSSSVTYNISNWLPANPPS
jgi:hypothetical protein